MRNGKSFENEGNTKRSAAIGGERMNGTDGREIREALRVTRGNRTRAAKLLEISRSTLYLRMETLGIR